ncbi:hypothetical protein [Streptomyces sp. NPDC059134]|uniref:hypothetical protein n=1 Tax=Streptomyces sp. NPDC059134 TaxID=3346738 RepID=UPI0036750F99
MAISSVDLDGYRRRFADGMASRGCWPEDSPWVRGAVDAVPRDLFAPERVWVWGGEEYAPVDRAADPRAWADAVYAGVYDSTVSQVTDGLPTSSLSCVPVVADMLDSLMPEPGHRVLELGTGAGWNAALLGVRVGAGRVAGLPLLPGPAEQGLPHQTTRRPKGSGSPSDRAARLRTTRTVVSRARLARMTQNALHLTAAVTHEDEWYVARCLQIEVTSQGATIEEALGNLREALELYLEDAPAPEAYETEVITAPIEVRVA